MALPKDNRAILLVGAGVAIVIAVVLVAVWIWRNNRQNDRSTRQPPAPAPMPRTPVVMVACRTCGTHLAQDDALPGRQGQYCSAEHRRDAVSVTPERRDDAYHLPLFPVIGHRSGRAAPHPRRRIPGSR